MEPAVTEVFSQFWAWDRSRGLTVTRKLIVSAYHKRLGHRLREIREAAALSQAALAVRLEVNQTLVGKIEWGDRRLDLRSVCEAIGVDLLAFVSEFAGRTAQP